MTKEGYNKHMITTNIGNDKMTARPRGSIKEGFMDATLLRGFKLK